jgi:hypothetical protein
LRSPYTVRVEVAGAARRALRLRPVPEVLEAPEAEQVLGRLDADAELVAVVGAGVREPVDDRPDGRAQDQPPVGDLARALAVRLAAVRRRHRARMPAALSDMCART